MTLLTMAALILAGVVLDPTGQPLPGAVIAIKGTTVLAVTDAGGRFSIARPAGDAVLVVAMPGFRTAEVRVRAPAAGADAPALRITLEVAGVAEEVVVRAPAVAMTPDARLALRPLDIVRTAGAQADSMRALAVLPGVVLADEGTGLFVRGGDVSETRVMLDSVPIAHPYRYETPTGGFRGAVDPFLTQGVSFTTGGFSAEYGNSLSAVVDMRGLTRPGVTRATATAGLAGVAGSLSAPVGDRGGVRVSANRSTPQVLFAVNPSPRAFDWLPGGWDVAGSADYVSPTRGTFHIFGLEQRDHVGVQIEQDAFVGFLHSGAEHRLVTSTWQRAASRGWSIAAAAGGDWYTSTTDVGVLFVAVEDASAAARFDAGGPAGPWQIRLGAEVNRASARATGQVPQHGEDFGGVGGARLFDVSHADVFAGGFGEVHRTFGRLTPTVGVRVDRFVHAGATRVDPRVDLAFDLGGAGRLRLAWGHYHQAPSPQYFDAVSGAETLRPMSATHTVAGYEIGRVDRAAFFRAEVYAKQYRDLPVERPEGGFDDTGFGHARGVDLFLRRVWHFIDVRAVASFVETTRRWTPPNQQARYPLPAGTWTPDFSIPFSAQLVVNAPVSRTISVGLGWRTAAGRPFTPAIGAIPTPNGFEPIWGARNSDRLPRFERLDLSVSKTHIFGNKTMAVFFASMDNALDRPNFFEYAYSPDYSERRPVTPSAPRSVYFGCSITR